MIDTKTADKELQTYIRPQTFPVAIRMLKPGEPIPERAKRPRVTSRSSACPARSSTCRAGTGG